MLHDYGCALDISQYIHSCMYIGRYVGRQGFTPAQCRVNFLPQLPDFSASFFSALSANPSGFRSMPRRLKLKLLKWILRAPAILDFVSSPLPLSDTLFPFRKGFFVSPAVRCRSLEVRSLNLLACFSPHLPERLPNLVARGFGIRVTCA